MTFDPATLEAVLRDAEALPDARARRAAADVAARVLDLHRAGLTRLVELVGADALARAAADELVGSLLELHGLAVRAAHDCQHCGLCGLPLAAGHPHLFELQARSLACACDACGMLFDSLSPHRYRRVRPMARRLDAIRVSDPAWTALGVPVGLAFFRRASATDEIVAGYPAPAGTVEAAVSRPAWQAFTGENPALPELAPDIEALLINRLRGAAALSCYHVSIDYCYRLAGLVRSRWRGVTGGDGVTAAIADFFRTLETPA